jgi:hypothetical protein
MKIREGNIRLRNQNKFMMKGIACCSFSVIVVLFSCNQAPDKNMRMQDSAVAIVPQEKNGRAIQSPKTVDSATISKQDSASAKISDASKDEMNIVVKTFQNENGNGYGYDLIRDKKVYVHQPNIPAVQGNSGFKTEDQARRVGLLAAKKIRMNILPPTIEIRELDSMGIH